MSLELNLHSLDLMCSSSDSTIGDTWMTHASLYLIDHVFSVGTNSSIDEVFSNGVHLTYFIYFAWQNRLVSWLDYANSDSNSDSLSSF